MIKTIIIGIGGFIRALVQIYPKRRTDYYLGAKNNEENFGIGLAVVLMIGMGVFIALVSYVQN